VVVEPTPKVSGKDLIKGKDPVKAPDTQVADGSDSTAKNAVVVAPTKEGGSPKGIGEPIPQPSRSPIVAAFEDEDEDGKTLVKGSKKGGGPKISIIGSYNSVVLK